MNYEARIPVSTYRLQFNYQFRFSDARAIVPYLDSLGISDVYASPYFKAQQGSLHGYDIVDPNALNSEVGTEEDYRDFIVALRKSSMGQVLDIVPNHMCIASKDNTWWMDVLENGPSSSYANFFDINWDPVKKELANKVLLPLLGDQYGKVLERKELTLTFEKGEFFIYYYENKFPLDPRTYVDLLGYRLEGLKDNPGTADIYLAELLSIITALNNLPAYTEKEREKVRERYREKEIIKKRLFDLYNQSTEIRTLMDENMRIYNGRKGDPNSFDLLHALLDKQPYRLSYWRVATDEINYRRFFDINQIAAVKMEGYDAFVEGHKLIFKLVEEGKVTGFRVDHPDGLYDPAEYFRWLQRGCFLRMNLGNIRRLRGDINLPESVTQPDIELKILERYNALLVSEPHFKPFYIVGEKILTKGEKMPEDWQIFSTTGYVFMNSLNGIFVKTENAKVFDSLYAKVIGKKLLPSEIVYEKKKLIMQVAMSSEINTLGNYLNRISEKDRHTRDFTLNSLAAAIVEVIAFFPVYRTYINASGVNDTDHRYIELAVAKAKHKNRAISSNIYDFLKDVLLLRYPERISDENKAEWFSFVKKFQQITGPVMAKGLEDTAFYVYNRLLSLNEVGGNPEKFGTLLETFHGQNIERIKFWPHALIATSTHDSKRSEDVRARINVLSEMPDAWRKGLIRWKRFNKKMKTVVEGCPVPEDNDEYFLYQTLVGAWPIEGSQGDRYEDFKKRIRDYMLKAVREAKVNSSWINSNKAYEDAFLSFIDAVLQGGQGNQFLKDFEKFHEIIAHCGMFNSLSQTLLKITSPGVPDFYQGTEIWDLSLVDPDNRRPVDYRLRTDWLDALRKRESAIPLNDLSRELAFNKSDGRIKLYVTYKSLNFRRSKRELFECGEYIPLEAGGLRTDNVCAFARRSREGIALTIAPRFFTGLIQQPGDLPFGKEVWGDSFVVLPFETEGAGYKDIFTDRTVTATGCLGGAVLRLSEVFTHFPVALMERTN